MSARSTESVGGVVVTAAMARDVVLCERRVELDHVIAPGVRVDPVRQMLWMGGLADLDLVGGQLDGAVVDLRAVPVDEREWATMGELVGGADHVLAGRLSRGDLVADVDVISRVDGRWTAALVRAEPFVDDDGRSVPRPYAVELGVAAGILGRTGLGAGDRGMLLGPGVAHRSFDLSATTAGWSVRRLTQASVLRARSIAQGSIATTGEAHARCRVCPHNVRCAAELERAQDLTLVRGIDRVLRPGVAWVASDRVALARVDLGLAVDAGLPRGLDEASLARLRDRAALQLAGGPAHARAPLPIRAAGRELHVNVDFDPTLQLVWSVGVLQRDRDDGSESHAFLFAHGSEGERVVVRELVGMLAADPDARVFLRSVEQLAGLCLLQACHPGLWAEAALERLVDAGRAVVLETMVIEPLVEWPGRHAGVLDVARAAGLALNDDDLSGATLVRLGAALAAGPSSATREALRQHDLLMCRASVVALDVLAALPVDPAVPSVFDVGDHRPLVRSDGEADEDRGAEDPDVGDKATDDELDWSVGDGDETEGDRDTTAGGPGRAAGTRHTLAATPPGRKDASAIYATPSLRVCSAGAAGLQGDGDGPDYRRLGDELPLAGYAAFRPTLDGGFELSARLRERAPWTEAAVAAVERSLRVGWWAGRCWLSLRPLLLVGEPGCGKTAFAREVGRIARVPTSAMDLGGASDALNLIGVSKGWLSATPSWPARTIADHGVANPLLIADELEKAGGHRGSGGVVHDGLLGMLEPVSARAFHDRCLLTELDLSAVNWIFTANSLAGVPAPLLSRLEVVEVPMPGPEHFDIIFVNVFADVVAAWGIPASMVEDLPPAIVDGLRVVFDRRRSVRWLRAAMERILSRVLPHRPRVLH